MNPVITPTRFHPRGEALAEGTPRIRVWGGIPGEPAELRTRGVGAHEVYAEWTGSPAPSSERVRPACPHWRSCGGCAWMHLGPDGQRRWRRERVERALAGVGLSVAVDEGVGGPDRGFRHLAKWVPRPVGAGTRLGAYGRGSHVPVDVDGCMVLAPRLRALTERLLPPLPGGGVRHLVARQSRRTGRVLATVVAREDLPELRRWAAALETDGLWLHLNRREGDGIVDPAGPLVHLAGDRVVEEGALAAVVEVGPLDFFQTNPAVAEAIWTALPDPGEMLVDLYGGVGAVGCARGRRVWGLEVAPRAVERANANLARNRVAGAYRAGPVAPGAIEGAPRGGTVVVNPPARGLGEDGVAAVLGLAPATLAYVSCDPESLARDLARLCPAGFDIERVTPFDLFPQTPHVETLVVLRARKRAAAGRGPAPDAARAAAGGRAGSSHPT